MLQKCVFVVLISAQVDTSQCIPVPFMYVVSRWEKKWNMKNFVNRWLNYPHATYAHFWWLRPHSTDISWTVHWWSMDRSHSRYHFNAVEWAADLCGANSKSQSNTHAELWPILQPSYTVTHSHHQFHVICITFKYIFANGNIDFHPRSLIIFYNHDLERSKHRCPLQHRTTTCLILSSNCTDCFMHSFL